MAGLLTTIFLILLSAPNLFAQIPSGLGWHNLGSTTILRNVCAVTQGFTDVTFVEGCDAVTADWNSAAFDTTRNRLILTGGGHNGYGGNELYALQLDDVPIRMVRLTDPALPQSGGTCETLTPRTSAPGGATSVGTYPQSSPQPNSRHTYGGLQYIPYLDVFWMTGGSLAYPVGGSVCGRSSATWQYSFGTGQ